MSEMVLVTEYRTRPGKRDELFELFDRLLAHRGTPGRNLIVWSNSAVEHDASYLFEYWSDSERFVGVFDTPWYLEYISGVDQLVKRPPTTTVTVPQLVEGI